MTDRDRLLELYKEAYKEWVSYAVKYRYSEEIKLKSSDEFVVDYLLENGVIVPPCKVGDTVYRLKMSLHTKRIVVEELEVERIAFYCDKTQVFCKGYAHSPAIFGKTVFLTKKEAEQALKERE